VKTGASGFAKGVGYAKRHVGVLIKIGCYVHAGFLNKAAQPLQSF
jgi:hypothetical protein